MQPTWQSECGTVSLYLGDCLDVLPHLSGVDAVVTDPPYGTGGWKRPEPGAGDNCSAVYCKESWDQWDDSWLWLTDAATVGMFTPQTRLNSIRRLFVWIKPDPRPRFGGQPAWGFEPFVVVRGSVRNCGGVDYIVSSAPREGRDEEATGHPHQKPLAVMSWTIDLCSSTGETVCDPFMGSGSTGVAAIRSARRFIGIEQDAGHFETAKRRIIEALNSQPLFKDQEPTATQRSLLCDSA